MLNHPNNYHPTFQLAADVTLEQEFNRNWSEIVGREYVFDRAESHAAFLTDVGLEDIKKVLRPLVSGRKLSVQVVGSSEPSDVEVEGDGKETNISYHSGDDLLSQPDEWRKKLKIHPVLVIQN